MLNFVYQQTPSNEINNPNITAAKDKTIIKLSGDKKQDLSNLLGLDLTQNHNQKELHTAYKKAILKNHSDKIVNNPSLKKQADENAKLLNNFKSNDFDIKKVNFNYDKDLFDRPTKKTPKLESNTKKWTKIGLKCAAATLIGAGIITIFKNKNNLNETNNQKQIPYNNVFFA